MLELVAGRYRLEAEVGKGGMGTVFLGFDMQSQETIAIKRLTPEIVAPDLIERFKREGEAIDAVYLNFGEKNQKPLRRVSLPEVKRYLEEGHFRPGSMRPIIEAIIQFLESGGEKAIITSPENLLKAVEGKEGTTITK